MTSTDDTFIDIRARANTHSLIKVHEAMCIVYAVRAQCTCVLDFQVLVENAIFDEKFPIILRTMYRMGAN